jgi:rhodanese-related sulfurtransferase
MAAKLGYNNIYWFKGGIQEWRSFNYPMDVNNKYKGVRINKISPFKVAEYMKNNPEIIILDVRPNYFKKDASFIKNSLQIPLLKITKKIAILPKDKKIIVSDWAMRQSLLAAQYLSANGFTIIGVIRGGIKRWVYEGFPIEKREYHR